jgi:hypothetical protein
MGGTKKYAKQKTATKEKTAEAVKLPLIRGR